jgi:hypothetical protein
VVSLCKCRHSDRCEMVLHCGFNLQPHAELVFLCLLATCVYCLVKYVFMSFVHFSIGFFVFRIQSYAIVFLSLGVTFEE